MNEVSIEIQKLEEPPVKNFNYFQVDALKALMIFFVIMDHSLINDLRPAGVFWERMSIPMFLVIMGFNIGCSFKTRGDTSLKKLYSWNYFKSKFWRYVVPFLIIYLISTLVGLIFYDFRFDVLIDDHFKSSWGDPRRLLLCYDQRNSYK